MCASEADSLVDVRLNIVCLKERCVSVRKYGMCKPWICTHHPDAWLHLGAAQTSTPGKSPFVRMLHLCHAPSLYNPRNAFPCPRGLAFADPPQHRGGHYWASLMGAPYLQHINVSGVVIESALKGFLLFHLGLQMFCHFLL